MWVRLRSRHWLILGAGVAVYNDTHDMADQALNCVEFFRNESCGKCVPCRIGSEKVVQIAQAIVSDQMGRSQITEQKQLVAELIRTMEMTSICGLGFVAAKPLQSTFVNFAEDIEQHLQ